MNSRLQGLGVALVTPFLENGEVDYDALVRLVDHVSDGGVDYLVVLGTTGETPTLENKEKNLIFETVKKANKKNLPIVLGMGGNATDKLIRQIKAADLDGVDAILSVAPYYNRPSQQGLYEHYKAVAEAAPCDVILYNVPGRTGVNLLPDTAIRLANECKNIIAIKEASGKIEQFDELLAKRPEGFMVISGDDGMALEVIKHGGDGLISVAANAFPEQYAQMITKQFDKEYDTTQQLWEKVAAVTKLLFEEGNPTGIKAALAAKGICNNKLRLPLVSSSDSLYERIRELILRENL